MIFTVVQSLLVYMYVLSWKIPHSHTHRLMAYRTRPACYHPLALPLTQTIILYLSSAFLSLTPSDHSSTMLSGDLQARVAVDGQAGGAADEKSATATKKCFIGPNTKVPAIDGCGKCRYTRFGCKSCRDIAEAAAAEAAASVPPSTAAKDRTDSLPKTEPGTGNMCVNCAHVSASQAFNCESCGELLHTGSEGKSRRRSAGGTAKAVEEDEDVPCEVCGRRDFTSRDQMLLCDSCPRGYHMYCLPYPKRSIPQGDWHCPLCFAAQAIAKKKKQPPAIAQSNVPKGSSDEDGNASSKRAERTKEDETVSPTRGAADQDHNSKKTDSAKKADEGSDKESDKESDLPEEEQPAVRKCTGFPSCCAICRAARLAKMKAARELAEAAAAGETAPAVPAVPAAQPATNAPQPAAEPATKPQKRERREKRVKKESTPGAAVAGGGCPRCGHVSAPAAFACESCEQLLNLDAGSGRRCKTNTDETSAAARQPSSAQSKETEQINCPKWQQQPDVERQEDGKIEVTRGSPPASTARVVAATKARVDSKLKALFTAESKAAKVIKSPPGSAREKPESPIEQLGKRRRLGENKAAANRRVAVVQKGQQHNRQSKQEVEELFTVERILSHRTTAGKVQFLVKWETFDSKHNSWEPEENIIDPQLVQEYYSLLK